LKIFVNALISLKSLFVVWEVEMACLWFRISFFDRWFESDSTV